MIALMGIHWDQTKIIKKLSYLFKICQRIGTTLAPHQGIKKNKNYDQSKRRKEFQLIIICLFSH
jgi:hypothetical protein